MESIFIKGTKRTPEIIFKINGFLSINGVSIPEDASEFYKSTMEWLEKYERLGPEHINLKINFVYLNTTSTYIILKVLRKVLAVCKSAENLKITWTYELEDHDMYDQGKVLEKLIGFPFKFEAKQTLL